MVSEGLWRVCTELGKESLKDNLFFHLAWKSPAEHHRDLFSVQDELYITTMQKTGILLQRGGHREKYQNSKLWFVSQQTTALNLNKEEVSRWRAAKTSASSCLFSSSRRCCWICFYCVVNILSCSFFSRFSFLWLFKIKIHSTSTPTNPSAIRLL